MTVHDYETEAEQQDRQPGRRQGQGWYLEDLVAHKLLNNGFRPHKRVTIWGREVDVIAQRDEGLPTEPDSNHYRIPSRIIVSCMDWYNKEKITPSRLWRLISIAFTVRAAPLLVHNERTELTSTSQDIAKQWRVRVVTDQEVKNDTILPRPKRPDRGFNTSWPTPLGRGIETSFMSEPDFSVPASARKQADEEP